MRELGSMTIAVIMCAATFLTAGAALAGPIEIAVANGSFENGTCRYNNIDPDLENGAVAVWQGDDIGGHDIQLFNDSSPGNPLSGITEFYSTMPDGHNCAGVNARDLWQTLSASLTADHTYSLSVHVGAKNFTDQPTSYEIALIVGDISGGRATGQGTLWEYVAHLNTNNTPQPGYFFNNWPEEPRMYTPVVITGAADALDPKWAGQPLNVLLSAVAGPEGWPYPAVLYDDVKVTAVKGGTRFLGMPATVRIVDNGGNTLETHNVVLDGSGNYTFNTNLVGDYKVIVKTSHWLAQSQTVTLTGGDDIADFSLKNGDVNGDNVVNGADFDILKVQWNGAPPADPNADLEGDGRCNAFDLSIVKKNWNVAGDQ